MSGKLGERNGLRRFQAGAVLGLIGGIVGLVLPVSVNLLAFYDFIGLPTAGTTLVEFTSLFVVAGALLFALSLVAYRFGFAALSHEEPWFYTASVLCLIGSVGLVLIVIAAGVALETSPTLAQCIRGTPSLTLTCLEAVQPLTAYSVVVGFWLAWFGGLGIVVGLGMGGGRYHEGWLVGAAAAYALLILVLIDPFAAMLFPLGGWQYPLLTVPVLALLAPALVYLGSRSSNGDTDAALTAPPRTDGTPTP